MIFLRLFRMSFSFSPRLFHPLISSTVAVLSVLLFSFSLFLSRSLSLPSLVFLGILFACGLVTAGRGESRGLAVNPLYVGIQISSACARNIRSPPSPPARRPCHPSCRRKEMSPRLPLTGFVTARDRADSKVKYVWFSSSFSSPFCDKLCGKYNIDVAYRVCR